MKPVLLACVVIATLPALWAQDKPTGGETPQVQAPAEPVRLSEWPKPASKDQLLTEVERLVKARTEEMGTLAHEALLKAGDAAVPFLLDRFGKEKDEGAHERMRALLIELIKPEHTRLLAKRFASPQLHERSMAMWRAGLYNDKEIRTAAEAAWTKVEKQGEKADEFERYAAALVVTSSGSMKGLGALMEIAQQRWDKYGQEIHAALRGVRGPEATAIVSKGLAEAERKPKVAALRLLAGCGDKSATSSIRPLLDSDDNSIRVAAINALRGIVDGEAPLPELSSFEAIEMAKKWKARL